MARSDIMEHIGEMLDHGLEYIIATSQTHQSWTSKLARFAKDYVQNGSHGTQSERASAMLVVKRKLFQRVTGLDPDVYAHYMNTHWLIDAEGDE